MGDSEALKKIEKLYLYKKFLKEQIIFKRNFKLPKTIKGLRLDEGQRILIGEK